jgi:hypothetical protein
MAWKSDEREDYVQSLLTDEVLEAYNEASEKFKTGDLVILFREEQISVYPRQKLFEHLKSVEASIHLIDKLSAPASESLVLFRGLGMPSFWFVTDLPNSDETVCCAIAAARTLGGGLS